MFYGGLVRKKNVLGVMMQCIFLMGMMQRHLGPVGLLAGVRRRSEDAGFSPWIGNADYLLMRNVEPHWDAAQRRASARP